MERLTNLVTEERPASNYKYELMAEGDKVAVVGSGMWGDEHINWVQVFRLENGKLVETWYPGLVRNVEW